MSAPPAERHHDDDSADSPEELRTQLAVLRERHERLQESYVRSRQARYTRTAAGFALLGIIAIGGAIVFPTSAAVLLALGGIGLFGALLISFLTPETFIATDVGRAVYDDLARTEESLVTELALSDTRLYLPPRLTDGEVRLFIPEGADQDLGDAIPIDSLFVLGDAAEARGVAIHPSGRHLVDEFEQAVAGGVAEDPARLAGQLSDALVEQFELLGGADPDVDLDGSRLTVAVTGSAYGPLNRLNHPVTSFVAVGLARVVDEPVRVEVATADDRADEILTCRWDVGEGAEWNGT